MVKTGINSWPEDVEENLIAASMTTASSNGHSAVLNSFKNVHLQIQYKYKYNFSLTAFVKQRQQLYTRE
jgi:hypothetical protein